MVSRLHSSKVSVIFVCFEKRNTESVQVIIFRKLTPFSMLFLCLPSSLTRPALQLYTVPSKIDLPWRAENRFCDAPGWFITIVSNGHDQLRFRRAWWKLRVRHFAAVLRMSAYTYFTHFSLKVFMKFVANLAYGHTGHILAAIDPFLIIFYWLSENLLVKSRCL